MVPCNNNTTNNMKGVVAANGIPEVVVKKKPFKLPSGNDDDEPRATPKTATESSDTMQHMPGWFYDCMISIGTLGKALECRTEIVDSAHIHPGMEVLDVACGTGDIALAAAQLCGPTGRVVGVDVNPNFLDRARSKVPKDMSTKQITFVQGSAECLPFKDETFNVVMMTLSLHHFPTSNMQAKVLHEMKRVLKAGGKILIVDFPGGAFPGGKHVSQSESNGHANGHGNSQCQKHDHHQHHHRHGPHHGALSACCGNKSAAVAAADPEELQKDPLYLKTQEAGFYFMEASQTRLFGAIAVTGRK